MNYISLSSPLDILFSIEADSIIKNKLDFLINKKNKYDQWDIIYNIVNSLLNKYDGGVVFRYNDVLDISILPTRDSKYITKSIIKEIEEFRRNHKKVRLLELSLVEDKKDFIYTYILEFFEIKSSETLIYIIQTNDESEYYRYRDNLLKYKKSSSIVKKDRMMMEEFF